jgi:hypothetical protein
MVNHSTIWLLLSIYIVLTGFVGQKAHAHMVVALVMKKVVTIREDVAGISHTYMPIRAAISLFIDASEQVPLILPNMHGQKLLTLHSRSLSRWGRECLAFSCSYNGRQYNVYGCVQPAALPITQDTEPTIVDTPLTLIVRMR